MRPQPLIAVTDVESSSRWYQRLLDYRSDHGGHEYERLLWDGQLILQLHSFEVQHHHGRIGDSDDRPYGNGVLLWFEAEDFDAVVQRELKWKWIWLCRSITILLPAGKVDPIIGNAG
jgi:hypothetical protein